MATVPNPSLDLRTGAQITAESIGALPDELSDRSDSNPAVVIIEACGNQFDRLMFQLNQWPSAVVQKCLSLIGVTLNDAVASRALLTFTLSQPQNVDTVIPLGTTVTNADGSVIFSTVEDLTIEAYSATQPGTITITSGSATVTGSGTSFDTSGWEGWQIQGVGGDWYTIDSVASGTSLTLTTVASSTQTAVAFYVGPITGSVTGACTEAGAGNDVAANTLVAVGSAPGAVASVNNASAATGGEDAETVANVVERAPLIFTARDFACTASDYAYFSKQVLGPASRTKALANTNGVASDPGYVTLAMLSPNWTTTSSISAQERADVMQDLYGRTPIGASVIDVSANIQSSFVFVCGVIKKSIYDDDTVDTSISTAFANYFNPYVYPWGRTIYVDDMVELIVSSLEVDRTYMINSVPAVGVDYAQSAASSNVFTIGSPTVTGVGATDYAYATAGKTFIVDVTNNKFYLVTAKSGGSTFTLDRAFEGATVTASYYRFTSIDTDLSNWYSLPYASDATVFVLGSQE